MMTFGPSSFTTLSPAMWPIASLALMLMLLFLLAPPPQAAAWHVIGGYSWYGGEVSFPSIARTNSFSTPPGESSFGLPLLTFGQDVASTTTGHSVGFYPLTTSNPGVPARMDQLPSTGVKGPSAIVSLRNGSLVFLSVCALSGMTPSRAAAYAVSSTNDSFSFVELWSDDSITLSNATCIVLYLPSATGDEPVEHVAIVGGFSSTTTTTSDFSMPVSFWNPLTLEFHYNTATIYLDGLWEHSDFAKKLAATRGPLPYLALQHPTAAVSSDGKLAIAGGMMVAVNTTTYEILFQSASVVAFALTFDSAGHMADMFYLPSLPSEMTVNSDGLSSALTFFQSNLYMSLVVAGTEGAVARLSLAALLKIEEPLSGQRVSDAPTERAGALTWNVVPLGGQPYARLHSSFHFLPIQRDVTALGLFGVGGIGGFQPYATVVIADTSAIPTFVEVPYAPSASATVALTGAKLDGDYEVNITVSFDGLVQGGINGYVALSPHRECQNIHPIVSYTGSTTIVFSWLDTIGHASAANPNGLFYLCFSDGESVTWYNSNGEETSSTLYTVMNPLEPTLVSFPSEPPKKQSTIAEWFQNHWVYVVIGGLSFVTLLALIVSVRLVRQRLAAEKAIVFFTENSPLLPAAANSANSLHIATNSHSSRYATQSAMMTSDGVASDVTYLVKRRKDGVLLVMKYIACSGDVERLLSMAQFETLHSLQGHPNVVKYYDMFMNYTFSQERLAKQQGVVTSSQTIADGTSTTFADTNQFLSAHPSLNSQLDVDSTSAYQSSSRGGSDLSDRGGTPRTKESLGTAITQRYVCLVMEYMPEGNVGEWLMQHSRKRMSAAAKGRLRAEPSQIPPAAEQLVLSIVFQINGLLRQMHGGDYPAVHKGIKPENVLVSGPLSSSGTFLPVAVSDFGFSVLGPYAPPREKDAGRHNSNELDMNTGSDCGSRSSLSNPMDTSTFLQNPKCDMWCLGCLIFALCTYRFGRRFPSVASNLAVNAAAVYNGIRDELRERGYSQELSDLVVSLLHTDDKLRPSSEYVDRMFSRNSDGTLSLCPPATDPRRR